MTQVYDIMCEEMLASPERLQSRRLSEDELFEIQVFGVEVDLAFEEDDISKMKKVLGYMKQLRDKVPDRDPVFDKLLRDFRELFPRATSRVSELVDKLQITIDLKSGGNLDDRARER